MSAADRGTTGRRPPRRTTRPWVIVLAVLGVLGLVTACSGSDGTPTSGDRAASAPSSPSASPSPSRAAPPPAAPVRDACYRLSYDEVLAATSTDAAVGCSQGHTSQTYAVGRLRATVDGHLLGVESDTVQRQVADTCPQRLAGFLGGTAEDRRLSMLRAVWFTPTAAQAELGASWYRCDVVAVVGDDQLARVKGDLKGVLGSARTRTAYSMCATDQPGTADFRRVLCGDPHTWRAVRSVDLSDLATSKGSGYPGLDQVKSAGDDVCAAAARALAPDALDYQWGYEWPTRAQWSAGQTYGRCWAPDSSSPSPSS